jgi:hypothetical protein
MWRGGDLLPNVESTAVRAARLIDLCDQILGYLEAARRSLQSARNWGIVDMLGGKLITNLVKHGKMDAVRQALEAANPLLEQLRGELSQVSVAGNLRFELGGFGTFSDFVFDNFFVDLFVQSKIGQLREQVERTGETVAQAREALAKMLETGV